ncbi:NADH dehydrogenase subunit 4L (mitochondrion) [Culicoides brevitarsis]|uniref:NADH dehydrogenase subunit 4L n=1 Tax=Culicoides brevitarsis TaxID=469753 RepID=UPI002E7A5994|nr:NADH dehydrogenase subunit 4L [Culicoides brevitarsis]WPN85966.1 NADH dehydrogenase subunit 4L [Culicoides brevitarsis]
MMIYLNLWIYLILFILSLMVFIFNHKHLLMTLISLEMIVLIIYGMMFICLNFMNFEYFYSMMFLTFSVCEGSLGLSILVALIRTHGNDYFQTFNILQC